MLSQSQVKPGVADRDAQEELRFDQVESKDFKFITESEELELCSGFITARLTPLIKAFLFHSGLKTHGWTHNEV